VLKARDLGYFKVVNNQTGQANSQKGQQGNRQPRATATPRR